MKNLTFVSRVVPSLSVVLLLILPGAFGQHVDNLIFLPRNPQPGATLKIEFSLSGDEGQAGTVELTVRADRDGDKKFRGDEVVNTRIPFKDNGQGDEETSRRRIRLSVYQIPKGNTHQEYTAKVVVGQRAFTTSLVKPGTRMASADTKSGGILSTLFNMPADLPNKIFDAIWFLRERTPADDGNPAFVRAHSLYFYSLPDHSLQRLAHSDVRSYRSPKWSADSKSLTFVESEGDVRKIAWIDLNKKEEIVLTDGPDDFSPHWLPNNRHVIFIRSKRLHVIQKETKRVSALESPVNVDHILGVFADGKRSAVIYTASDKETPDEPVIYRLDLDQDLRPRETSRMIYSPNWFLFGWTSPDGGEVLLWKDATIYKVPSSKVEFSEDRKLIKDSNRHYDPSWSPDGKRVAFVTMLP